MNVRALVASVLAATAASLWAAPASADVISIGDDYVGGIAASKTSSGYSAVSSSSPYYQVDRIGDASHYEVYGMTVTYDYGANSLSVAVESSYFDNVGSDGTTLGDLFISSDGWNMGSQSSPYKTDTSTTGEDWEYVLVVDNRTGATSGNLTLYRVSDGTIKLTSVPSGYICRAEQEATFTANSGATAVATGTWSITNNSGDHDFLTFNVALSGTTWSGTTWSLLDAGSAGLGFHWAMTCGNDTIEGFAPVPEPATVVLFGAGLAGAAALRRRRARKALEA
jgi:hypothetical protein